MSKKFDDDHLLTTKETASILGITANALEKHRCWQIGLPYIRVGRTVRYRYGDVVDLIARGRVVPSQGS